MAGFLGRVAAKLARTPIVIHSLHGITFHKNLNTARKKLYVYLEMLTGHWTDYFITVGEDVKQKYLSIPIGTKEKYFTVRSGFDFEKFSKARDNEENLRNLLRKELRLSQRDVLIGMVSRIEPRKGHIYLLRAAKVVIKTHPQSKFLIIGEGYYKEALMHEVKKARCENNFVFTGHRNDVERMMVSLDIFVLTSLWEGLPRVLVQAALLGKPIVTFDVEGAREVVKENVNGFIVPTKDVQLLAVRLIQLIDDLDSARRIGKRGMELVDGFWDKNVMVKQTVNIYNEIISQKANGSKSLPAARKHNFDNAQITNDI